MNSLSLKELARVTLPSRPQGEGIGYLDSNLDGKGEIFFPVASHRDPGHPLLNDVGIITVDGTLANFSLTPSFEINVDPNWNDADKDAAEFPTLTHNEELYPIQGGVLQSGWLQDLGYFDFDGDGTLDLFISGHGREWPSRDFDDYSADDWGFLFFTNPEFSDFPGDDIRILLSGDTPRVINVTNEPQFYHQAAVGDIDGDGDPDIVATNLGTYEDKWVKVYWNDGSANFSADEFSADLPPGVGVSTVEVSDFNQDGFSEILLGSSDFSFIGRFVFNGSSNKIEKLDNVSIPSVVQGHFPDKFTVGDYDGDGDVDFLAKFVSNSSFGEEPSTYLFRNTDGMFSIVDYESPDQSRGGDGPELIDINNDGLTDIVYPGWTGNQGVESIFEDVYLGRGGDEFTRLSEFIDQNQLTVELSLGSLQDPRLWHWDVLSVQGKNLLTAQFYGDWKEYSTLLITELSVPIREVTGNFLSYTGKDEALSGTQDMVDILTVPGSMEAYELGSGSQGSLTLGLVDLVTSTRLESIERLLFNDGGLALDIDGATSAGGIYRLYKATFNREPDASGLGYWIAQADAGNKDAVRMAEDFVWSQEFQDLYNITTTDNYGTGTDVEALVTGFYENVLGRTPDQGGLDFYTGVIESQERTVGRVLAEISDSQENYDGTIELIANGIGFDPWVG